MKLKWRIPAVALTLGLCLTFYIVLHISPRSVEPVLVRNLAHIPRPRALVDKSSYISNHTSLELEKKTPLILRHHVSIVPEDIRRLHLFKVKPSISDDANYYKNVIFTQNKLDPDLFSDGDAMNELQLMNHIAAYRRKARLAGKAMDVFDEEVVRTRGVDLRHWERWYLNMSQYELYHWDDKGIDEVLFSLTNEEIIDSEQLNGGTQLKLKFTFKDDLQALFKPMRFPRDVETLPDHFYFSDFERHHSEIAAFHLDRVLGFRRCPPVAGRIVNITREIEAYASPKFRKTIFNSPAGNKCFFGKCSYYCDTNHAICGHPDWLEGSFAAFLPPDDVAPRNHVRHPWRRSYSKYEKAEWETNTDYCLKVRQDPPYNEGRLLIDLIDLCIFDFLQGNMDRHHYEIFNFPEEWGNDTVPILLDNGRGFGKQRHDEMSILAPLYQCCTVRHSTLQKLLLFDSSPATSLSSLMRFSLAADALRPVLTEGHLSALDRRVRRVLAEVQKCVLASSWEAVVIDDGY